MANCLIALGSNLGEREATLRAALTETDALPLTRVVRSSRFYEFAPVGGPAGQEDFLNAAALIDTQLAPLALHEQLSQIEARHGRQRNERWSARTLDLDLLLYDQEEFDSPILVVPHPRMSFRRFVLEPAAEVAGEMIVPKFDWSVQQLLDQLNHENDRLAILSPAEGLRRDLCQLLTDRYRAVSFRPALDDLVAEMWPQQDTAWLSFGPARDRSIARDELEVADGPKLTILLSSLELLHGRGPTLTLQTKDLDEIEREVSAAIESVWPDLG
jgi:2-amino-4-hydroxy-6-hydroxymethyldihydropteridine diphosphokinase